MEAVRSRWQSRATRDHLHNERMTVLSRSDQNPHMLTVQCDFCRPPALCTNQETVLTGAGWQLMSAGASHDICPACRRDLIPDRVGPRVERSDSGYAAGRLPNLLLIGAAKCGTSSLHAYLDSHPDIAMAGLKELRYFQDPDCARWESWYRSQFDAKVQITGESSTMYTRSPALPGVAERMASVIPGARLIYMVRDPVERAVASYFEERFQLLDPRPIGEAFADIADPYNPYVSASRYAEQLEIFLAHYPREQLLLLPLTDLRDAPEETMKRVFAFVGVDPQHVVDTRIRHNEASAKYEYSRIAARVRRGTAGRLVRRLPERGRAPVQAVARRLLSRPQDRPPLPPELKDRLKRMLRPDAERFRELSGLPVADWSI